MPRLEAALKLAERRAREQFYDKEEAWVAVSQELYRSSMEEIQMDETFSRILYLKHCVDKLVIQHPNSFLFLLLCKFNSIIFLIIASVYTKISLARSFRSRIACQNDQGELPLTMLAELLCSGCYPDVELTSEDAAAAAASEGSGAGSWFAQAFC